MRFTVIALALCATIVVPNVSANHGGYCNEPGQYAEVCTSSWAYVDYVHYRTPYAAGCAASVDGQCIPSNAGVRQGGVLTTVVVPTYTVGVDVHATPACSGYYNPTQGCLYFRFYSSTVTYPVTSQT